MPSSQKPFGGIQQSFVESCKRSSSGFQKPSGRIRQSFIDSLRNRTLKANKERESFNIPSEDENFFIGFLGKSLRIMATIKEETGKVNPAKVKKCGSILETFLESKMRGTLDQICKKPAGRIHQSFLESRRRSSANSPSCNDSPSSSLLESSSTSAKREVSADDRIRRTFFESQQRGSVDRISRKPFGRILQAFQDSSKLSRRDSGYDSCSSSEIDFSGRIFDSFVESRNRGTLHHISKKPTGRILQAFIDSCNPSSPDVFAQGTRSDHSSAKLFVLGVADEDWALSEWPIIAVTGSLKSQMPLEPFSDRAVIRLPFLLRLPLVKFPKLIYWSLPTISEGLECD